MQQKGFRPENPFYGEIQITSIPSGLRATVTARALNEQFAFEAVVFFLGRMLDTGTKSQIRECFKVLWARMNHGQIYLAKKCESMRTTKFVMILRTGTNQ